VKDSTPLPRRRFLVLTGHAAIAAALSGCGKKAAKPATKAADKHPQAPEKATEKATESVVAKPPAPRPKRTYPVVLGTLLGPGRHDDKTTGKRAHYIAIVDLDAPADSPARIRRIPTTFFGHGIATHPTEHHRAVVFEKKGPGACAIDLRTGAVTAVITTTKDRAFYGHGVFSTDGKKLYCTESITGDRSERGLIAVRDGKTYKLLGTFPSHGRAPHDLHLVDEGRTLVVTNGGGRIAADETELDHPNVAWVDVKTQQLQRRLPFDARRVNAGHVALGPRDTVAVVSAPRTGIDKKSDRFRGGVSFLPAKAPVLQTTSHRISERFKGEVLSVAIHQKTGVAATTCPDGGVVAFWDAASGALLSTIDLAHARGVSITLDGAYFAVTHGKDALVTLVSTATLQVATRANRSWMSGSHTIVRRDIG